MLNVLGWLLLGSLIGWLGSLGLSSTRGRQINIVVAIVGALLSRELRLSLSALFIACLGAACLLAIVNAVLHGRDVAPAG